MNYKLLIINPGSTSTKIAVYENETPILVETLRHSSEEINSYPSIYSQLGFRKDIIAGVLEEKGVTLGEIDAIIGRGGLLKPMISGTYRINDVMLEDLKNGYSGQHASNLGGLLAKELADINNVPAFIVDPVVVDELQDIARLSGMPELKRVSIFHALNQKAVAKRYAKENEKPYEELNLIVAHLGGGVSVGAHHKGRVIEVNNALDGEGPFSPERAGTLPTGALVKMCFSGEYTKEQILKKICGQGGFVAYLGTNDARVVENLANDGNEEAKLIFDAFCYQVSKAIGECAAALKGQVDSIILTGGIAYGKPITKKISESTSWIAPITVYPGEDEMLALAQGGLRVLRGEEEAKEYK